MKAERSGFRTMMGFKSEYCSDQTGRAAAITDINYRTAIRLATRQFKYTSGFKWETRNRDYREDMCRLVF